jgi:hypothetical protein
MQNNFTSLNGSIHSLFNQRFSFKHLGVLVASVLAIVCAVWLPYALFWQLDGLLSLQQAQILGSFMFYGGIASFVAIAVVTRFRLSKDWSLKRNVGVFSVLLLVTLVFSSLLSAPVVAALTPLPSDSGPNGSSAYKFSIPFTPYEWFIGQFRDGSYYAVNGSDWNIMTIVEPWQPVAPWASLSTNLKALTEQCLSVTSSGVIFLKQVPFDLALIESIPENVKVACSYQDEYYEYINSADTSGSPYTVEVGAGVNVDNYIAKDSENRICFTSTDAFSLVNDVIDASPEIVVQDGALRTGTGKNVDIQLGLGIFKGAETIQFPPFSTVKLNGVNRGEWLDINIVTPTSYFGGTLLYYTGNSGCAINCSGYGSPPYPTTAVFLSNMEIRVHNPDSIVTTAAVNLRGLITGAVTSINILTDNIPGTNNVYYGLDARSGASSNDKEYSHIMISGFRMNGFVTDTSHAKVEYIDVSNIGGEAYSSGFSIQRGDGTSFSNLHAFSCTYGLNWASGPNPLVIDGAHFETNAHNVIPDLYATAVLHLINPVFEHINEYKGYLANTSRVVLTNPVFKTGGPFYTETTNTITDAYDGMTIDHGLGAATLPVAAGWITVTSNNATTPAIVGYYNPTPATFTLSLKDTTGASLTGQTVTWKAGIYPTNPTMYAHQVFASDFRSPTFSDWTHISSPAPTIQSDIVPVGVTSAAKMNLTGGNSMSCTKTATAQLYNDVSFWVYVTAPPASAKSLVLAKLWTSTQNQILLRNNTGTLFFIMTAAGNMYDNSSYSVSLNTWYYIRVQYNVDATNGYAKMYVGSSPTTTQLIINQTGLNTGTTGVGSVDLLAHYNDVPVTGDVYYAGFVWNNS